MEGELQGKVALITGGARGFGRAFGEALGRRGARVVLVDLDDVALAQAVAELADAGVEALGRRGDVVDEARMASIVAEVQADAGGLDLLVNNAGLHSAAFNKPSGEIGLSAVRRLFDVNVMGVLTCSLAARDALASRPGSAIVNISSSASYGSRTAYGVSKLAVRGLTASLAHEFAPLGIRVNGIAPGLIFTNTIRAELGADDVSRVMAGQVLKKEGAEQDIVEALLYLASERAGFVTGETLRVTGGYALSV